jgi:hypothetical protein
MEILFNKTMEEYTILFTELENQFKDFDRQKKFNILFNTGLGRVEKLHSNLIADLLKLNKKYFELFLEQIGLAPDFIEFKDAKIHRELPAGGYVDIFIRDKKKIIIIENKVDDRGKSGQLQKYCDALQDEFKIIESFYLTKYGELPPKDRGCDYECLSYEKDIVQWLEKCIKETTNPTDNRIKVSLEIYVELVRNIINRDKYMEEVFDYLKKDKNKMSLAIDVYNTLNGRNFFEDTNIRDRFKKMFKDCYEECIDDNSIEFNDWIENTKNESILEVYYGEENPIGEFYFYFNEIYAQFPDEKVIPESHIIGRDLSNETLKALLKNDTKKVNSYIAKCVDAMLNYQKNTN